MPRKWPPSSGQLGSRGCAQATVSLECNRRSVPEATFPAAVRELSLLCLPRMVFAITDAPELVQVTRNSLQPWAWVCDPPPP